MPTTTTQTIIIKPGETFSLPPDAEVIFISSSDVDASCGLPVFEDYACYQLNWSLNDDESHSPNLEHQDSLVYSMTIGGAEFLLQLDTHAIFGNNLGSSIDIPFANQVVANAFIAKLPAGIILVDHVNTIDTGARRAQTLYFQTFPSIADTLIMKITGPGFTDGLYIKPTISIDCTDNN